MISPHFTTPPAPPPPGMGLLDGSEIWIFGLAVSRLRQPQGPLSSRGGHPWEIGLGGPQWKHGSQVHPSVGFSGSVECEHLPHGSTKVRVCLCSCREGFCGHEQQGDIRSVSGRSSLVSLVRQPPQGKWICASNCSCRKPCPSERCLLLSGPSKEKPRAWL